MNTENKNTVCITDSISKAAKIVDLYGTAVVMADNEPKYVMSKYNHIEEYQAAPLEEVIAVSEELLERNKEVYEKLAKW